MKVDEEGNIESCESNMYKQLIGRLTHDGRGLLSTSICLLSGSLANLSVVLFFVALLSRYVYPP